MINTIDFITPPVDDPYWFGQIAALNGPAMEATLKFELHACTDVTGFGIIGHLLEVALGGNSRTVLRYSDLPIYPGTLDMYRKGETTRSNQGNHLMVQEKMEIEASLSNFEEEILYDPQTSGGLLLSVPKSEAQGLVAALSAAGVQSAVSVG